MTPIVLVILLMILGLALLGIEILVLPGVGVIGFLGLAAIVGSGVLAYSELAPGQAGVTIAVGLAAAVGLLWLLPRTRTGRAMVLRHRQEGKSDNPSLGLSGLVGREAITVTPLRPSGTVDVDDRSVDVVSDGQYVAAGSRVRIVSVRGSRVVVEPVVAPAVPEDAASRSEKDEQPERPDVP